jgi:hypothetical protein
MKKIPEHIKRAIEELESSPFQHIPIGERGQSSFTYPLLIGLAWLMLLFSCNPEKIIARKDARAFDRVNSKFRLFDSTGRRWILQFPCLNDSAVVYVKGDTLVFSDSVLIHDTDKVTNVITDKWYITKRIQTTVTKLMTVKDHQLENLLRGDKELAIKQALYYQSQTIQAQEQADDERKKKNLYLWLLIGIGVGAVGTLIYKIWPKPTKTATDLLKGLNKN